MSDRGPVRWSVVGVGIAGRARVRAVIDDPRAELVCAWRGRFAADLGVPLAQDLQEAIERAEAVAICSPTSHHAEQVRAVLRRGRHALVEFPIATSAAAAEDLFASARSQGRILHVEHIELLDAPSRALAAQVRPETVEEAEVRFTRQGPTDASAPDLAIANVARLHRLLAAAGPARSIRAVDHQPGVLQAELELATGARATCRFEQAPYLQRRTTLSILAAGSRWTQRNEELDRDGVAQEMVSPGPLFGRDQRRATARILDGAEPYVSEARILHVLDVVDRLGEGRTGALPHRSDAVRVH